MKNHEKAPVGKLMTRFDKELKALLLNDLNHVRSVNNQFSRSNRRVRFQVVQ
jgi:hypothetical protein